MNESDSIQNAQNDASDLEFNTLSDEAPLAGIHVQEIDCLVLSEMIKINSTLTSLDLSRCGIGDEGCKIIADALQTNSTIIKLCLIGNKIGDEGCKTLADMLKVNTTLKILQL